jgi:hypothetical protein
MRDHAARPKAVPRKTIYLRDLETIPGFRAGAKQTQHLLPHQWLIVIRQDYKAKQLFHTELSKYSTHWE